jgi:hypothetical protein
MILHTLDNAGHGFDDVIAQKMFCLQVAACLTVDVGFKGRSLQGISFMWLSNGETSLHTAEYRKLGQL